MQVKKVVVLGRSLSSCWTIRSPITVRTKVSNTRAVSTMSAKLSLTSTTKLASGYEMPLLGYGVYQTPFDVCEDVVSHAFKTGYRHVDSARVYRNEKPCAEAMRRSGLDRKDIFFTSKIGPREMGYENAKKAIATSFQETGLDYIDLYLIHAPYGGKTARCGTWRALREAQEDGLIRSIGVSNYGVHHLDELKEYIATSDVGGTISVGQWELHPWLPHHDIVSWARANNVAVQAWSPLVRAERTHEPVLQQIGAKHGRTWAQVLIRWSLQQGFTPLPKSVTHKRIEENTAVYDFELDAEDLKKLDFPDSYAPCSWDPTVSRD